MSVRWCVDHFDVALSQDKAGFFLVTTKVRECRVGMDGIDVVCAMPAERARLRFGEPAASCLCVVCPRARRALCLPPHRRTQTHSRGDV